MFIQAIFLMLSLTFMHTVDANYSLTVEVTNINAIKGDVFITIYDKPENFPKSEKKYKYKITKAKVVQNKLQYTFSDLPQNTYAVAISHDANSNGKFDSNFVGMPLEGYGFSNNFVPKLSAPKFSDVDFKLDKNKSISIKMIY
jgi:uncharacterized protein (DUF2141 family)